VSANKVYEVRDPIYGFVTINGWERDIINHPVFQRLRRIKQLAFTDMVYPGATHTRFEHSLGVMHLASKAYDILTHNPKYWDRLKNELNYGESGMQRARMLVRLAALLHDIGHGPFSHVAEDLMPRDPRRQSNGGEHATYSHEDYSALIIRTFFRDVIDDNEFVRTNSKITADEVAGLLEGDPKLGSHLFWRDLLTSQMDVDRMDYLLRDSYHCGVRYGVYDLDRLLHTLAVTFRMPEPNGTSWEHGNAGLTIGVEEGGWHAAEELILSRYAMFTQVYFHKARRAYDHHLQHVMKATLKNGRFPVPDRKEGLEEYLAWDDWRVSGVIVDPKSGEHAKRIRDRDHYREVYHTNEVPSADELAVFEEAVGRLEGVVRLQDSADKSWYKFKKEEIVVEKDDGATVLLSAICPVVKGLEGVKQMRLYADVHDRAEAHKLLRGLSEKPRGYDDHTN
jgi:HD superfamily phosphohydrolase